MDFSKFVDRFEFQDDRIVDDNIGEEASHQFAMIMDI